MDDILPADSLKYMQTAFGKVCASMLKVVFGCLAVGGTADSMSVIWVV